MKPLRRTTWSATKFGSLSPGVICDSAAVWEPLQAVHMVQDEFFFVGGGIMISGRCGLGLGEPHEGGQLPGT